MHFLGHWGKGARRDERVVARGGVDIVGVVFVGGGGVVLWGGVGR